MPQNEEILLFEEECDVSAYFYKQIEPYFKFSNGMFFYKEKNFWTNDIQAIKPRILRDLSNPRVYYEKTKETVDKTARTFNSTKIQGRCANGSMKTLEDLYKAVTNLAKLNTDENFINKFYETTKGKICFNDGVYDFPTKTFTMWKDAPEIYSTERIPRNYLDIDTKVLKPKIDYVLNKILTPLFNKDLKNALNFLSRGLAGHIEDKSWGTYMGNRNCGKSVLTMLCKYALGSYFGSFDANCLLTKKNRGDDEAKALYWLLPIMNKRICISNEIRCDDGVLSSPLIKANTSGGDAQQARNNHQIGLTTFVPQARILINSNDQPTASEDDVFETMSAFKSVVRFMTKDEVENYRTTLGDLETFDSNFQVGDDRIKDYVKMPEFCDAFLVILMDYYSTFKATTQKTDNKDDKESLLIIRIKSVYDLTFEDTDTVSNDGLRNYIKKEKLKCSLKKLKEELKGFGCKDYRCAEFRGLSGMTKKIDADENSDTEDC